MHRTSSRLLGMIICVAVSGLAVECFAQCEKPPSDDELSHVYFACCGNTVAVAPGTSAPMRLTDSDSGEFRDYTGCVTWSVDPPAYFSMDSATGVLTTSADAPDGHAFIVIANLQNGRRLWAGRGIVVVPERYPLLGVWSERTRFACGGGQPIPGEPRMQLARFDGPQPSVVDTDP